MRLPRILLLIVFAAPLRIHAQTLDRKFAEQDIDKERTSRICSKQYSSAQYFSVHKETESKSFSSALAALDPTDEFGEFRDFSGWAFRFIKSPKGVQAIFGSVEQQSSGKWKCKRGPIEEPMLIGKEYKISTPVYVYTPPGCWLHSPLLLRPNWDRPCISKLIGYQAKRRMLKEEKCAKGGTCLVLYKQSAEGKMAKRVIGVSVSSMQEIFPYKEDEYESEYGEKSVSLGPSEISCSYSLRHIPALLGIDKAKAGRESYADLYKMCLGNKASEWF